MKMRLHWTMLACAVALSLYVSLCNNAFGQTIPDANEALETVVDIYFQKTPRIESSVAQERSETLYVDLLDFVEAVDFPIATAVDGRSAAGWFISEDATFRLDLHTRSVTLSGETQPLPPDALSLIDQRITVESGYLEQWFPVTLAYDPRLLRLVIEPTAPLPIQELLAPQRRGRAVAREQIPLEPQLPPYPALWDSWIGVPSIDLTLSQRFNRRDHGAEFDKSTAYSVRATGDVLKGTTEFFGSGNDDDLLQSARLNWRYFDWDNGLFGPLGGSEVALGDISTVRLDTIIGSDIDRGLLMRGGPIAPRSLSGRTDVVGTEEPGYTVELYRNSLLVGEQVIGADGLYEFRQILLLNGTNVLRLEFRGPQGQRRVQEETVTYDPLAPSMGELTYALSVSQDNNSLLTGSRTTGEDVSNAVRAAGTARFGLGRYGSLIGRAASYELSDDRHTYLSLGWTGAVAVPGAGGVSGTFAYIRDFQSGSAVTGELQYQFAGFRLRGEHRRFFDDYRSDRRTSSSNQTRHESEAQISKSIDFGSGWRLPLFLSGEYDRQEENSIDKSLRVNTTLSTPYGSARNALRYSDDTARSRQPRVDGQSQVRRSIGPVLLRGTVDYEVRPDPRVESVGVSGRWRASRSLIGEVEVERNLINNSDDVISVDGSLDWDFGYATVGVSSRYDTNGALSGLLSLRVSAGADGSPNATPILRSRPLASTSRAAVTVYLDENANGVRDEGEPPVPNAEVAALQQRGRARTNEDGRALLTDLRAFQPTDIVLKERSEDFLFAAPLKDGGAVYPVPGRLFDLEVGLVNTGEIEGRVLLDSLDGSPLSQVPVLLVPAEGGAVLQSVKSDREGYYLLEDVKPGTYAVLVDDTALRARGARGPDPMLVTLSPEGDLLVGMDIIVSSLSGTPRDDGVKPFKAVEPERTTAVQIGAYLRDRDAIRGWKILSDRFPDLLDGLTPTLRRVRLPELGKVVRLVVTDLPAGETGAERCSRMRARAMECRPYVILGPFLPLQEEVPGLSANRSHVAQLGAFRSLDNAQKLLDAFKSVAATESTGEAKLIRATDDKGLHLVVLQSFPTETAAQKACRAVVRAGFQCFPRPV